MGIKNWKEFKVGELFTLERGKEPSPKRVKDGVLPMINEINENNGIAKQGESESIFKKNAITISVNYASNVFYQPEEFIASVNILIIRNEYINKYTGLFLAGVLREKHKNYDYVNKISKERLENEDILLPATPSGDPDWDYMESYMKEMEEKAKERLDRLEEMRKQEKKKIDVSGWGEFKVGDLFDVYLSKDDIQPKHLQEGDTPLISSGKEKNGIVAYITDDNAKLWDSNTLTVDMFGKVFYQNAPYYCVSHGRVNILYPKTKLNEKVLQFVASVIEQVSANKYDFTDMCTAGKIKNDVLLLPVTSAGTPDWDYMERYMSKMEEKAKKRLERLSKQ